MWTVINTLVYAVIHKNVDSEYKKLEPYYYQLFKYPHAKEYWIPKNFIQILYECLSILLLRSKKRTKGFFVFQ
ncbi:hypothetical protein D479_09517 [Halobacillus sp. BAB-2008]|nr:hypothetical protein D479_09517 [Halobacillus sp. BAB-2008]